MTGRRRSGTGDSRDAFDARDALEDAPRILPSRGAPRASASDALVRGTEEHYRDAALYDVEYAEYRIDVPWYLRVAHAHGKRRPIIELGAGTGRISLPLLRAGHHVIALERMPQMLDALRDKLATEPEDVVARADLRLGDMLDPPVADGVAALVLAPFNVLMHLYEGSEFDACFRQVARMLAPGGIFACDVLVPDLEWLVLDPDERHAITKFTDPHTGLATWYSTNHVYDPDTQICHIRLYYDPAHGRARRPTARTTTSKVVQLAHRQIYPQELRVMLAHAGLRVLSLTADFSDHRVQAGSESMSVIARREP